MTAVVRGWTGQGEMTAVVQFVCGVNVVDD